MEQSSECKRRREWVRNDLDVCKPERTTEELDRFFEDALEQVMRKAYEKDPTGAGLYTTELNWAVDGTVLKEQGGKHRFAAFKRLFPKPKEGPWSAEYAAYVRKRRYEDLHADLWEQLVVIPSDIQPILSGVVKPWQVKLPETVDVGRLLPPAEANGDMFPWGHGQPLRMWRILSPKRTKGGFLKIGFIEHIIETNGHQNPIWQTLLLKTWREVLGWVYGLWGKVQNRAPMTFSDWRQHNEAGDNNPFSGTYGPAAGFRWNVNCDESSFARLRSRLALVDGERLVGDLQVSLKSIVATHPFPTAQVLLAKFDGLWKESFEAQIRKDTGLTVLDWTRYRHLGYALLLAQLRDPAQWSADASDALKEEYVGSVRAYYQQNVVRPLVKLAMVTLIEMVFGHSVVQKEEELWDEMVEWAKTNRELIAEDEDTRLKMAEREVKLLLNWRKPNLKA